MSAASTPSTTTVRVVTLLALAWAAAALVAQVVFSLAVVPRIAETIQFTIPGRGPSVETPVDTAVISIVGLIVAAVGTAASLVALLLARRHGRIAYIVAVLVCVLVPGFTTLVVVNGATALATDGGTSTGSSLLVGFAGIAAIALAALSILAVPKYVAQRLGEPYAE